jgi:hypothetical protein
MADFFRIQLGIVSRAEGHCAAKRSAYQSCGIVTAHDGERFDFSRKAAEHVATFMLAPPEAPDWVRSPESLWQRAAAAEKRVDAQEARIIDFSMPRAVPAGLWEACIRHVYGPFLRRGMVLQIDVHDTPASDSGRNVNVHGLATLRELDGDGFAAHKNRQWNDHFRERNGRAVREAFAERLTAFCCEHGIEYIGDARPNSQRNLPEPEPELPRWNFEHLQRTGEMTEALDALHNHRKQRRQWEAAQADEIEAALNLAKIEASIRERRKRRLAPAGAASVRTGKPDRRAAVLRAWHGARGWIDADAVAAIRSTRFDAARSCLWIDLKDGSTLVDHGDSVALRGRLTWQAAWETAAAAERHGWESVEVHGDQAYKDAVAVACMLRNIDVTNHVLSPKAQAAYDRLRADQDTPSISTRHLEARSSLDIHLELTKRRFVEEPPPLDGSPVTEEAPPVYKPRFSPPKKRKSNPDRHVT